MNNISLILVLGLLSIVSSTVAQPPQKFSYQGVLTNSSGQPIADGTYNLTFKLYTDESGGTAIWTETHTNVPVSKGTFGAILGSVTPLTGINFAQQLYLGVTRGDDSEFTPRSALTSAPSSLAPWKIDDNHISYTGGNVGVGTALPSTKVHVKGSTNASHLTIDANSLQSNYNPLVRLRSSSGADLLWIHSDDESNTFIGTSAGQDNSFSGGGRSNTFIGSRAGFRNVYGADNSAIGHSALYSNTIGAINTAVGVTALYSTTRGVGNTAQGWRALYSNTIGNYNTASGVNALASSTTGIDNTAHGRGALSLNTTGGENTAVGSGALRANVAGSGATAVGTEAMWNSNSQESHFINSNVAVGYQALKGSNTPSSNTGNQNTAVGFQSLRSITAGNSNTAHGYGSLASNTAGSFNTASGYLSLYSNTTGFSNTAKGSQSLQANTTGGENTAIGISSLYLNSTGSFNTAIGGHALYNNRTVGFDVGSHNTGVGHQALFKTTTAQYNTAVGYNAGDSYDNGYNNVFVGANTDVDAAGLYNVIAIGHGTIVTAVSTARFGNSSTGSYGGWANWTNVSDVRFKKNVKDNVPGLDFINKLRPITYNFDATGMDAFLHKKDVLRTPAPGDEHVQEFSPTARALHEKALQEKERTLQTGFVAQEVETAARELGYDFSGVDAPKNADDYYGLRYAEFVVPLVKAVQELHGRNAQLAMANEELRSRTRELLSKNEEIRKQNEQLNARLESLEAVVKILATEKKESEGNLLGTLK